MKTDQKDENTSERISSSDVKLSRRGLLRTVGAAGLALGAGTRSRMARPTGPGIEKWSFDTGARYIFSSPTISGKSLYFGSTDNNLYSIDVGSGEKEWSFATEDYIDSSPAVEGGTVYVGSEDSNLYAVDAESGTQQWKFETGGRVDSSPNVVGDTVYVGSADGNLYAVDTDSGDQRWKFETGSVIGISSPTVVDGTVYIGSKDNRLYAVDGESGVLNWYFNTGDFVNSSPTISDGVVYVGSKDHNLYAINKSTGEQEWSFDLGALTSSSPTVADGTVFVGSDDHNLYAVDKNDGTERWSFNTGNWVRSSPTVAEDTVYVGSLDNNIYAVNMNNGEERWSLELGEGINCSPTVAQGTVYIGGKNGSMYAIGTSHQRSSTGSRTRLETLGYHGESSSGTTRREVLAEGFEDGSLDGWTSATRKGYCRPSSNPWFVTESAISGSHSAKINTTGDDNPWLTTANRVVDMSTDFDLEYAWLSTDPDNRGPFTRLYRVDGGLSDCGSTDNPTVETAIFVNFGGDAISENGSPFKRKLRFVGTERKSLSQQSLAAGERHDVKIEKRGSQATLYIDGREKATVPVVTTGQYRFGVRTSGTYGSESNLSLDDISVTEITQNKSPSGSFTISQTQPSVGESIRFDASGSADPDGSIQSFEWDFDGDGTVDATGQQTTHSYSETGTYTVKLTVTDSDGASTTANKSVTVSESNQPPTASFSVDPSSPTAGSAITFDASGSSDDSSIVGYEWDFNGDGTVDATGSQATYTYQEPGVYTVTLTVTDDDDVTATSEKTITVSEDVRVYPRVSTTGTV